MRRSLWGPLCLLAAAMQLAPTLALAQPSPQPSPATVHPIRSALDAAWLRQPEHRSATQRREAAESAIRASQRWTADAAALELTATTDRLTRNQGGREYDASVSVPLWLPGERGKLQASASAEATVVAAQLALARWKLAERVREAYWELARTTAERQLAEQRLRNAGLIASDVARRLRAGDLARADAHQAESAVAGAEAALAEATAASAKATRRWQALAGSPETPPTPPTPPTLDELRAEPMPGALALEPGHPALAELRARSDAAQRQRELAGIQTRSNPELTVGAVRDRGAFGERYSQSLVVGVRIPLGASRDSPARVAAARAEELASGAALDLERVSLEAEAAAAREELQALQGAAGATERRARLAAESRGFFEKSFRLGETDLPTRLRIESEAFEAERQASRARIEWFAALSRLRQALGLLPE